MRNKLLISLLSIIILILVLHLTALNFFFYWVYWWFDLVVHFLGGVWAGIFGIWFVFFSGYIGPKYYSFKNALVASVIVTLTIGIMWEIFEFGIGAVLTPENYIYDTLTDIMLDSVGALVGALVAHLILLSNTTKESVRLKNNVRNKI